MGAALIGCTLGAVSGKRQALGDAGEDAGVVGVVVRDAGLPDAGGAIVETNTRGRTTESSVPNDASLAGADVHWDLDSDLDSDLDADVHTDVHTMPSWDARVGEVPSPQDADAGTPTRASATLSTTSTQTTWSSAQATAATQSSTQHTASTTTTRHDTNATLLVSSSATGSSDTGSSADPGVIQGPPAGNPNGTCAIPEAARAEDVSRPDYVVGTGSAASCTADAFIAAVEQGGVITFDCGPEPVVITLDRPAKVRNDANSVVTIDGGELVTLSGGGNTRILYMNTCDQAQVWTTPNCDNQDHPRLTVQNLTFIDGNSKSESVFEGGGAIYASGGRFKVVNSRFFNNVCADDGPDVGGAAIRVLQQYQSLPVYVVNSTFGGAPELGNACSNGGGISSIGVSWTVLNSVFSYNRAIGFGGNPPDPNTLGGGSGGAIYNDGNTMTLSVCGSLIEHNQVNMYGSAIFFASNDHSGSVLISSTTSRNNTGGGWDALYPGISLHEDTFVSIDEASIIE